MDGAGLLALGVLALLLTPIAAIDLAQRRIPDLCNLALGAAGLAYALARRPGVDTAAWALAQAAAAFLVLAAADRWVLRLGKGTGLGGGDVKFLVAASLWVGMEGGLIVLVAASVALAGSAWLSRRAGVSDVKEARPFGPLLAVNLFAVAALAEWIR